jgi:hypothetical protein
MKTSSLLVTAAALVAGCNSFDPKLGEAPFQCGSAEPYCPDGYTCIERSASIRVCERGVDDPADAGPPDATPLTCRQDSAEPNDDRSHARLTPVSEQASRFEQTDLSMCPGTDRDMFSVRLATDEEMRITVDGSGDALELNILNEAGAYVSSGDAVEIGVTEFSTLGSPLAPGRYVIEIFSSQNRVSSYGLVIKTCTGPLPGCLDD